MPLTTHYVASMICDGLCLHYWAWLLTMVSVRISILSESKLKRAQPGSQLYLHLPIP